MSTSNTWLEYGFRHIVIILMVCMVSGCVSTPSKQLYENHESNISLEKPGNWHLEFIERSGLIFLEAESGTQNKDSARIEIYGTADCGNALSNNSPEEAIVANIDRIRDLYHLDSVTVVQEPLKVKTGDIEVTKATITISTILLPEDSASNQMGERSADVFQTIDILAIGSNDDSSDIMVFIYKGNSETLNIEAGEIVNSIQPICSTKP